jgi:hypothetical protein
MAGRRVGIPYSRTPVCPARAHATWFDVSGITIGPLFRPVMKGGQVLAGRLSGNAISAIMKQRAAAICLDSALYSGHAL